jgi:homoserine O-acetyltransferase
MSDYIHDRQALGVSVGEVELQSVTFPSLALESGRVIEPVTIAYETYGALNEERSNAILVLHALSGDAHAAGYYPGDTKPGWWETMIGPGKGFDTDKFCVICSNVLGGCKGSSGPSSINPATGREYGVTFPFITVGDMVRAQKQLIDHLEIPKLLAVAGGSMGGMQAMEWAVTHPEMVSSVISIASAPRHSPMQIAFNEVGREAIMGDPNWNGGDYYDGESPDAGLAVARMIGHITYLSDAAMEEKFGRRMRERKSAEGGLDFEVESYLVKCSRAASTPTPISTSPKRSTTSICRRGKACWWKCSVSCRPRCVSWSSRSAATGCIRRINRRRSSTP